MKHFTKIADFCPEYIGEICAQIEARPGLWNRHRARLDAAGSPHSQVDDIWLRYNDISKFPDSLAGFNDEHIPIWYSAWRELPILNPVVFELMRLVHGEMLGGVLITRVPPGSGIARHTDASWHVDYYDKFYLCLEGGPGREFHCEAEGIHEILTPAPGQVHRFDNHKPHWVVNSSNLPRMTLIVCIHTEMFSGHP